MLVSMILNLVHKCTLKQLKQAHALVITMPLDQHPQIRLKFLRRSTEVDSMDYAHLIFTQMCILHCSDTTLWNAMLRGYAYNGPLDKCLKLFDEMILRGLQPNNFSYPYVLSSCSQMGLFRYGQMLHCRILKTGFDKALSVSNSLFELYFKMVNRVNSDCAKSSVFSDAMRVFNDMSVRPVELWNKVISQYTRIGDLESARNLFDSMVNRDVVSWNAMISGYAKKGDLRSARNLFDSMVNRDVVSWNTMISVYAQKGDLKSARNLFDSMVNRDVVSWNTMISVYVQKGNLVMATDLFEQMPMRNVVTWTTMVKAYATAGNVEAAQKVFEAMPERNVVSWNCMISSFTQSGKFREAVDLFDRMQYEGIEPDGLTFVPVLSAYAHLGNLDSGKWVHFLIKDWSQLPINVGTALVELYAKCGDIDKAFTIFIKLENKDGFCYNVMIKSLASHGRAEEAIKIFYMMKPRGLKPNDVSFTSALFACCHRGLIEEGRKIFHSIENEYDGAPTIEHYGCMVDLFCRNSQLEEAQLLVQKMPFKPDISIWGALLNGCSLKGDFKSAESIIDQAENLNCGDESGVYVLLANIHASTYQWLEAAGVRKRMEARSMWKTRGSSSVL